MALCFLHVSRHNYPGGVAFSRLHQLVDRHIEEKISEYIVYGRQSLVIIMLHVHYSFSTKNFIEVHVNSTSCRGIILIAGGDVSVHIGVEAAMTGVSRFGELNPAWK